jgi:hypothetical protein
MSREVPSIVPHRPRTGGALVALALAGCGFDADYRGGTYRCSDGVCPSGLTCEAQICVAPRDGGPQGADAPKPPPDAMHALTCGDPGDVTRGVTRTISGTTAGGANHVSAACGAFVMNGPDDVFRVTAQAGDKLDVSISGDSVVRAYVLATCPSPPATPTCEGGTFTEPGVAGIALPSLTAGTHYVVVDSENAALGGSYAVTVDLRP